ncbi:hypothetical protein [Marinobacter arenosus]|uniref:hypothetical protein n=1 Tax=Marinobacter arenosus TaxID=2856822 RepID=UPI001C4B8261|nr:hypothetical protein [Marinobacter arenosus]MBW0147864.1 hypothetical protein [Marinobacter arenosus]
MAYLRSKASQRRQAAKKRAIEIDGKLIAWFSSQLRIWFARSGRDFPWRHPDISIYEVVILELLLQRTRAETVSKHYSFFFDSFPDWRALAEASTSVLESQLKPFGLYRRRAEVFQSLGKEVNKLEGKLPHSRDELKALPGLGDYIVNAILMYRDGLPTPLLDVNMARVLERFFGSREYADIRHDPYLLTLSERVVSTSDNPSSINWAVLDLARIVCKKQNPACNECPLAAFCLSVNRP